MLTFHCRSFKPAIGLASSPPPENSKAVPPALNGAIREPLRVKRCQSVLDVVELSKAERSGPPTRVALSSAARLALSPCPPLFS